MTDLPVGELVFWAAPGALLAFGAVFGFFPGFVLRLIVLLYPADDPRRRELVAELYVLGRMERIEWVFQQLETALFEGVSARLERRRRGEQAVDSTDQGAQERMTELRPEADEQEYSKRRKIYWDAALVTMGVRAPRPGIGVSASASSPPPGWIHMFDVRQLEAATRALRSLDDRHGWRLSWDAVAAQLSWGHQLLSAPASEEVRQRLHVALAELHNLAGRTAFDRGRFDVARDHFGRALELAKAGDADELTANILCRMGRLYLHTDVPDEALKMFELGQLAALRCRADHVMAELKLNEEWALAMVRLKNDAAVAPRRYRDDDIAHVRKMMEG
jgi:tetratricopeptide (TPR) repeat protein